MITFFMNLYRLFQSIYLGLRQDSDFRGLLFLLVTLLAGSTIFYWRYEGWSIIDSLYFSVMTMSTIGYGDLAPSHDLSKLFTIAFSILSIGMFAAVTSKIVATIIKHRHDKKTSRKK
jgi:hypothetical protein